MTTDFGNKQHEWNLQAGSSEDPGAQVARPGGVGSINALASDIAAKLGTQNVSSSVLDVGCGNGLILSKVAGQYETIRGVDYSDVMIAQARLSLPTGQFSVGEAASLPFADAAFDRVLCYSIFHYFPSDDYAAQAVRELVRVCRPGGVVLIGDILDKQKEDDVKGRSDLAVEKAIPSIHRYSEWRFYDLQWLVLQGGDRVLQTEILDQPLDFPLRHYRKDLRICL